MQSPGPFHLGTTRLILGPDAQATPKAVTPTFYQELDGEFGGFAGHTLLSQGRFTEAWPTWEMHPAGDECVYLLSGDADMVFWDAEHGERTIRFSEPGTYIVIPQGIWHTARPHQPTEILFFTPGEGTQNVAWPPGRER